MRNRLIDLPEISGSDRRAVVYVILSGLMFALAGTSVKFASTEMSPISITFWRNLFSFLIFGGWLIATRVPVQDLRTTKVHFHILRSFLTYLTLITYFFAIQNLPLNNAVLLNSLGPIFIPILALIFFRRISDPYVWAGVLVAFIGVAFVVQPTGLRLSQGEAIGLLSGLFAGGGVLVIWMMSSTESPNSQIFWFNLFVLILSLIPLPWIWEWPSFKAFVPLICLGVFTTCAQFFLSKGFSLATGDKISTWGYSAIIFSAFIGLLIFGESLNYLSIVGIPLVIIGAYFSTIKK